MADPTPSPELITRAQGATVMFRPWGDFNRLDPDIKTGAGATAVAVHSAIGERYLLTVAHSVTDIGNGGKPTGFEVDGRMYHVFFDQDRRPGLARLVSVDYLGERAILKILDPNEQPNEARAVLKKINPEYTKQLADGDPVLTAHPITVALDHIADPSHIHSGTYYVPSYAAIIGQNGQLNRSTFSSATGGYSNGKDGRITFDNGLQFTAYSGSPAIDLKTGQYIARIVGRDPLTKLQNLKLPLLILGYDPTTVHGSTLYPDVQEIARIESLGGYHAVTAATRNTGQKGFVSERLPENPFGDKPPAQTPFDCQEPSAPLATPSVPNKGCVRGR